MSRILKYRSIIVIALILAALLVVSACAKKEEPKKAGEQPAPAQPAAMKELIVIDSVVRGSLNIADPDKATQSCKLNNVFLRNEQIVWRMKVIDPVTGKSMTDQEIETLIVKLGDGTELKPGRFSPRPKENSTDAFWSTSFNIPEDYPAGTLKYSIEATAKDGRKGKFVTFALAPTDLTILPEARPKIEQKKS
ncbi:MAG: hypothetical protein HYY09_07630 [Firmicutes bacterium]|nr:hypothetical protein [Bacillota bacterium]